MNITTMSKIRMTLAFIAAMLSATTAFAADTASVPATSSSPLRVTQPLERAVLQRDGHGLADVPVAGTIADGQGASVDVRALDRQTHTVAKDWTAVDAKDGAFKAKLSLPAGWYQIEFRVTRNGAVVATGSVERVGVGDVFVTCGQSNSANHGVPKQKAGDDRVSSCDFQTGAWVHGDDPQPGATGGGGSPWALLGDLLVKKYEVPVGFICVGVGSTRVSHWLPPARGYLRVRQALQLAGPHGVRAVLWHQGESDSMVGTSSDDYARMLGKTIAQSRKDAGWDVPWGVALVSYHPSGLATPERQLAVVGGQKKVIAEVPGVFQGPETDSFHTRGFLAGNVHFNAQGLAAHAQGWADALAPVFTQSSKQTGKQTTLKP